MVLQIPSAILSSVSNVDDYITSVIVRGHYSMHHGILRSHRRLVDHMRGTYEILQDVVIASQDSDSMKTSELAAKHAFLHKCDYLIDRIDELLEHRVRESASILEPSQLPATSHAALWELFLTSQRVMQQRHRRVMQSNSTLSITASTSDYDVSHAAHTPELPQIELPSVTPSCPIATERLYTPSESPVAPTATHVTETLSSLIQCTSEEDSGLRVPKGRESDQISTISESRYHTKTSYAFTSLLSLTNPSSLLQSSHSGHHDRTESIAAFHGELQPSTCRCCKGSSHRLDNCIPSLPKGLQPAVSDKGCGIKRDYSLCHEVALSRHAVSCTVLECNESHKGRHKYHPEKSLGYDIANQKAPSSSPSSSSIVAQSNCAGRHLLLGERFPDDDIANLQAPSSSPPLSSTVVTTRYLSRHNTGHLDRPRDDDTANLPAPSHSSLSYSSDATQSTLVPDTSPVTQSYRSVILPTPSSADRYPLFPFMGHSAPALVWSHSAERERIPCRATSTNPSQESKHPDLPDTFTLGNRNGEITSECPVNPPPHSKTLMGLLLIANCIGAPETSDTTPLGPTDTKGVEHSASAIQLSFETTALNRIHRIQRPINAVNWNSPDWDIFPSKPISLGRSPPHFCETFFRDIVVGEHNSATPLLLVHHSSVASSPDSILPFFCENEELPRRTWVTHPHLDTEPDSSGQILENPTAMEGSAHPKDSISRSSQTSSCGSFILVPLFTNAPTLNALFNTADFKCTVSSDAPDDMMSKFKKATAIAFSTYPTDHLGSSAAHTNPEDEDSNPTIVVPGSPRTSSWASSWSSSNLSDVKTNSGFSIFRVLWKISGLQHSSAGHLILKHPPLEHRPTSAYLCIFHWIIFIASWDLLRRLDLSEPVIIPIYRSSLFPLYHMQFKLSIFGVHF